MSKPSRTPAEAADDSDPLPETAPSRTYSLWQFAVQTAKERHPDAVAALARKPEALTLREEMVVRLRFGFVDGVEKSTSAIAMRVGTTTKTVANTLRSGLIALNLDDLKLPPKYRPSPPCRLDGDGLPIANRLVPRKGGTIWHRKTVDMFINHENRHTVIEWRPHERNPHGRGEVLCAAPPMVSIRYGRRRIDLVGWSWGWFDFRGIVDGGAYEVTQRIGDDPVQDTVDALIAIANRRSGKRLVPPPASEGPALFRAVDQFLKPETRRALVRALVAAENPVEPYLRDDFHMEPQMLAALRELRAALVALPALGASSVDAIRDALAALPPDVDPSSTEPASE